MDLPAIYRRILIRLEKMGLTANAASLKAGKPDAIRNIARAVEAGRAGISTVTIAALAPALRTTVAWLTEEAGPEDPSLEEEPTIPVMGKAGAGGEILRLHEASEIDRIPAPEFSTASTVAIQIAGESLGVVFDNWYAVYDEIRDPPTRDLQGHLCVLELDDGRVFIKKLKKGRGKRFTLESNYGPPIYDVTIAWAARVKTMVPR